MSRPVASGVRRCAGPLGQVALVQVVGANPPGEQPLVQVGDGASRGVDAAQQHRLVLHRHAVVDQPLAGRAGLGGALLGVVEVGDHEERAPGAGASAASASVDPHRAVTTGARVARRRISTCGMARSSSSTQPMPLVGEHQRVAARDDHVAHLGMGPHVGDPLRRRESRSKAPSSPPVMRRRVQWRQ